MRTDGEEGGLPLIIDGLEVSNFFRAGHLDNLRYRPDRSLLEQWREGGLSCVHVTCVIWEDARGALDNN